MTFVEWLRGGGVRGKALSESTIATYAKVEELIRKAKRPTDILRPGLGVATKNKYVAVLRQWAAFMEDEELQAKLTSGPTLQRLLRPRESKLPEEIEAFIPEEIKKFLDILDMLKGKDPVWIWPCVSLQVHLGLRAGADLAGLRHDAVAKAVKLSRLTLMGKRGKIHQLPAGFVREELKALLEIPGWHTVADIISPDTAEEPEHLHREASYRIYRGALISIGEIAGIDASKTHRFRHWAITNFYYNVSGKDLLQTQRFARHASIMTTARYIKSIEVGVIDEQLAELKRRR